MKQRLKEPKWLRDGHSSIWLIVISKYVCFRTFSTFSYNHILPNLLFGHLQIKINVSKIMVIIILFLDCETILDKLNSMKNMSNGDSIRLPLGN